MTFIRDLFTVFKKPIGQNLNNDLSDITNVKNKLYSLNRYKNKNDNGYITHELDNSIRTYQRDCNLKIDGKILPGGETEATLFGDLFGMKDDDSNIKISNAALIPLIVRGASRSYAPAKKAWDAWQKASPSIRQDEIDRICYSQYQFRNNRCRNLSSQGRMVESEKCWAQSADDYADCLKEND